METLGADSLSNLTQIDLKRYPILDTYVNALSMEELIEVTEDIISAKKPVQLIGLNAEKVIVMRHDALLRDIINNCPLLHVDGASIVWAAKTLGVPVKERVAGIDLFLRLVELAQKKQYRIYLFGAKEEVVQKVREVFESKYPEIQIAGCRNGYFSEDEEAEIVADIARSEADMLFVGISSPQKEYWIDKYLSQLNVPFVMGVGGSFDVVAGKTSRAPLWMQRHGLEWFYRFMQEPRRLWKRYLTGNASFIWLTIRAKITQTHKSP